MALADEGRGLLGVAICSFAATAHKSFWLQQQQRQQQGHTCTCVFLFTIIGF
jgi:hypothetical protein